MTQSAAQAAEQEVKSVEEHLPWVFYALCGSVPLGVLACVLVWYRWDYIAAAGFVIAFAGPVALFPYWDFFRFILGFVVAAFVVWFVVIPASLWAPSPLKRC
jgi:hypothetical protein